MKVNLIFRMTALVNDSASRFIFTLALARSKINNNNNNNNENEINTKYKKKDDFYVTKTDFYPMMMDIIDSHPGLHFLKSSPQFHSRYCEVVSFNFN